MKEPATLKQAGKVLNLLEDLPVDKMQDLLGSGLISDLCAADPATINRYAFQSFIHSPRHSVGTYGVHWSGGTLLTIRPDWKNGFEEVLKKAGVAVRNPGFIADDLARAFSRGRRPQSPVKLECFITRFERPLRIEEVMWGCVNTESRLGSPRELIAAEAAYQALDGEERRRLNMDGDTPLIGLPPSNTYSRYATQVAAALYRDPDNELCLEFVEWPEVRTRFNKEGRCNFLIVPY